MQAHAQDAPRCFHYCRHRLQLQLQLRLWFGNGARGELELNLKLKRKREHKREHEHECREARLGATRATAEAEADVRRVGLLRARLHGLLQPAPEKGYSGTSVWTRDAVCRPLKAEEGITGRYALEGGPPGSITSALPATREGMRREEDRIGAEPRDCREAMAREMFRAIDNEGRALVLDCGLFVLFNLYCPNETGPERVPYK